MPNNFYIMVQNQANGALQWFGPYATNAEAFAVASTAMYGALTKWWIIEAGREPVMFEGMIATWSA